MCIRCRTEFTCRLPARSSRWWVGAWSPSPEDTATGAAPHQRAQLGLGAKAGRVADLDQQLHGADGGDAVLVGEGGAEPTQQGRELLVELGDPRIQPRDVAGRLGQPGEVDPVGRRELDQADQPRVPARGVEGGPGWSVAAPPAPGAASRGGRTYGQADARVA